MSWFVPSEFRRYPQVYKLIGKGVNERVFPGSLSKYEIYRTVSRVLLQRRAGRAAAQGDGPPQKLVVSNMHVVSGQGNHRIRGKNRGHKITFKVDMVTKGLRKAVDFAGRMSAPAAAEGEPFGMIDLVAAGDYNLHKDHVLEAVARVDCSGVADSMVLLHVKDQDLLPRQEGNQRDFIVCSRWCSVDLRGLPIAHDQQHRAVGMRMRGPIERYQAEDARDDDLAAERARIQEQLDRFATRAAARALGEESEEDAEPEPQSEEDAEPEPQPEDVTRRVPTLAAAQGVQPPPAAPDTASGSVRAAAPALVLEPPPKRVWEAPWEMSPRASALPTTLPPRPPKFPPPMKARPCLPEDVPPPPPGGRAGLTYVPRPKLQVPPTAPADQAGRFFAVLLARVSIAPAMLLS